MSRYDSLENSDQHPLLGGHTSRDNGAPVNLDSKLIEIVANYGKTAYTDNAERKAAEQYAKTSFSYSGRYQNDANNGTWTRFKNWAVYQFKNLKLEENSLAQKVLAEKYKKHKQDAQTMRHLMALCERQARLCPSMLPQTQTAFEQFVASDHSQIIKILHFQFQEIERALFFQLEEKVFKIAAELVKELTAGGKKKLPQGLSEDDLKTVIQLLLIGGDKKTGYIKKQLNIIRAYNKGKSSSTYLKIGTLLTDCEYHAKRLVKEQQQIKDNLRAYKRDINRFAQDLDVDLHIVQIDKSDKKSNPEFKDGITLKFERVAQWLANQKEALSSSLKEYKGLRRLFFIRLAVARLEEHEISEPNFEQLKTHYEYGDEDETAEVSAKTEAQFDAIMIKQSFFASGYRAMYYKEGSSKTKQSDNINISLGDAITFIPKLLVYTATFGFGALEFLAKGSVWLFRRETNVNANWTKRGARFLVNTLSRIGVDAVIAFGLSYIEITLKLVSWPIRSIISGKLASLKPYFAARLYRASLKAINKEIEVRDAKAAARAKKSFFRIVADQGSKQVGISQGATSFVGFNLFFAALVPMAFISLPLALLVGLGAALCNTILVRQDTYDTLKKFFLGGLFINDDGEYVLEIDPESPKWSYTKAAFRIACMLIVAVGSVGCGFSYGALAFVAMIKSIITPLFGLLALKMSAIIPTLFAAVPAIATMIGLTALFFVVAADFVVNFTTRCKSIWNYFKTTYGINWDKVNDICVKYHSSLDFKIFGMSVRPVAFVMATGSYLLGIVSSLAKLAIAVTFCLVYTTACFGSFYASGRALMLAVSTSSWSSIMVTALTYSNAVITGAFGLQKNLDFVDGISVSSIVTFIPKLVISMVGLAALFTEKALRAVTRLSLFSISAAVQLIEMPFKLTAIGLNKIHLLSSNWTPSIKSSLTNLFPSKWMPSLLPKAAPAATRWLLKPFDNVDKIKFFNKTVWKPTNHKPIAELVPAADSRRNSQNGQAIAKMHRTRLQQLWDMLMGCVAVNMVGQMLLFGGDKDAQKTTSAITGQGIAEVSIIGTTSLGSGGPNALASKSNVDAQKVLVTEIKGNAVTVDEPAEMLAPESGDLYPSLVEVEDARSSAEGRVLTPKVSAAGMFAIRRADRTIPEDVLKRVELEAQHTTALYCSN